MMAKAQQNIDLIKVMAEVQEESFAALAERRDEWIRENEHLPKICPVDVIYPRGDGLKFRKEHPVLGTARWHNGQDFNTPYGTDVYATGAGKVIAAGWSDGGFGNYVMIDHGYGFSTIYGHLSKIEVADGMNVKRGDIIGLTGNSGTSSGPHLHYQINFNGSHKNPLEFFADDLTPEEYRDMIMTLGSRSRFR
jgi:murein DD-endopeptidase MepM/ murein hydrolase activator NlpD